MIRLILSSLVLTAFVCQSVHSAQDPITDLMAQLLEKIDSFQVLKPQDFKPTLPLPTYMEKLGLYRSDIRVNFAGNPVVQELRSGEFVYVFDNDMFSTGWIVTALLDASLYGKQTPSLDAKRLQLALEAIGAFSNKNDENASGTIVRTFWSQQFSEATKKWYQEPTNIANVADILAEFYDDIPFRQAEKFFRALGLDKVADFIAKLERDPLDDITDAFRIPADFDDTYLNLGMGSALKRLSDTYPQAYKSWLANNTNCQHLIDVTSKYAYRPFDADLNKNTIDPRTYLFARGFLQQASRMNQSLGLITTWIQNIEEQRTFASQNISMPFNVNNVDVTVSANAIYGMTAASIDNVNNFGSLFVDSPDLQQIYLNTTKFITWAINSNFSGRPDLAQVYYPSRYNFLWYTSRTLFLLGNELKLDSDNQSVIFKQLSELFQEVHSDLRTTFETTVTEFLLANQKKRDPKKSSDPEMDTYFCDFLGADDTNYLGMKEPSNDDCLFTTAQAVNILISTWTVQVKPAGYLIWKPAVPDNVIQLLHSSVNWLQSNALDKNKKFKPMNAFFSGSVKGFTDLPFMYPTTVSQYLNGTDMNPDLIPQDDFHQIIWGIKGVVDEESYQKMLQQEHFHTITPVDFHGYNKDNFPFWSSEPYTHAVTLLALAQFNNLLR